MWDRLERARVAAFPLPPHGHCPNFAGARDAARRLLTHPEVAGLRSLIVGPERALLPLRRLALASGVVLYVPHPHRAGWYWRLRDPAGAQLARMAALGEPARQPDGAGAAVLACVAADHAGGRLGKGYGWGARGLGLGLPEYTLAHPLMLLPALPCAPDSHVALVATPRGVSGATPAPVSTFNVD